MSENIKRMMDSFLAELPNKDVRAKFKGHIEADWLLVNCIDCRYPHAIHNYMLTYHKDEPYDQLVLAGASLAAPKTYNNRQAWEETFAEHVFLSIKMHKIFGVLILDHRTCGAYRECQLLTEEEEQNHPEVEFEKHKMVAEAAADIVLAQFAAHKRDGFVHVYLTPTLKLGDKDFPTKPEELCKKRYRV